MAYYARMSSIVFTHRDNIYIICANSFDGDGSAADGEKVNNLETICRTLYFGELLWYYYKCKISTEYGG